MRALHSWPLSSRPLTTSLPSRDTGFVYRFVATGTVEEKSAFELSSSCSRS